MFKRFMTVWVVGLITIVPFTTYYLLFHAQRSEYALLIVLVLFWVFGYWGVVSPLLSLIKLRRFFKTIEQCRTIEDVKQLFHHQLDEETVVEMISNESRIPKFIARHLYHRVAARLKQQTEER